MNSLKDTILLNGKVYSVTGNAVMAPVFPLDTIKTTSQKTVSVHKKIKHPGHATHRVKKPRAAAKHLVARKRQRSQILMRHVVAKPVKAKAEPVKEHPKHEAPAKQQHYSELLNSGRLKRALETPKSRHINRFNRHRHTVHVKKNVALEVKPEPSISSHDKTDEIDRLIRSLAKR
jgi:hypothetical protein